MVFITERPDGFFYYNEHVHTTGDSFMTAVAASGGTVSSIAGVAAHPGIIQWTAGTSTTGAGRAVSQNSSTLLLGNSWSWKFDSIIKIDTISDGTNTYTLRSGFIDSGSAESNDGVFFRYDKDVNSGKWVLVARNNGTETTTNATNSAVAASTWYQLTILVNSAGTLAEFFQDGVSLGTVASNIPTGAGRVTSFGTMFLKSAGTADINILEADMHRIIGYSNVAR